MKDEENNRGKPLLKQAAHIFAGKSISFVISFLIPIILVRIFTKSDYGLYRQIYIIALTLIPILPFGLNQSLYYFYRRERKQRAQLVWQTFFNLFFISLFSVFILFILKHQIALLFNNPDIEAFILPILVYLFFMTCASSLEVIMINEEKSFLVSAVFILSAIVNFTLIIGLGLIKRNIKSLIIALIIFSLFRFILILSYLLSKYKISMKKLTLSYFRKQWKYAWPIGIFGVIGNIRKYADKLMISSFFSPEIFAIYSVGANRIPLVSNIFDSISNVTLPKMSKLQKENRTEEITELWNETSRKMALIIIPIFIFCLIIAKEIITILFTDQYLEAVPIFIVYLLLIPRDIMVHSIVVRAYAATKYILYSGSIIFLITVIMLIAFIKLFGVIGAAIANVIGLYLISLSQAWKGKELLRISVKKVYPWKMFAKVLGLSVVSALPVITVKYFLSLPKIPLVIVSSCIFFPLYLLMAWQILRKKEKEDIIKYLRSKKEIISRYI